MLGELTQYVTSEREAAQLLRNSDWDLNVALNSFYESPRHVATSNLRTSQIQKMFEKYEDPDEKDTITVEGCMSLCEDLGIDPTTIEFLIISHRLGAERMGEFKRENFCNGCIKLGCDSIEKLRNAVGQLRAGLNNEEIFHTLYNYAFLFGRQAGQKSLFGFKNNHGKAISRDTWNLFYDFVNQPNFNLETHDAEGAWPILIDEFVEYLKKESE
ncbi:hypothetical protein EC973_000857 [Apophysomyces ossiformis]|uniref:Defective in cullin neddylation protein n=1 Tax=Apophysomyces ossiformis TaxID=679940 RepID=A0A8H7BL44_9FUNG|nr:hypothetical protein EC973_000857 [Apophysomyces ossiformis]